jgi:CHASE2 domain-containing sensor protein
MAETVEGLARQQPKAIVFDIAFSDPDVFQAEADRYFREVAAQTPQTFFPMIRLNPENDALSRLRLSDIPGVTALAPSAPSEATVAMVVPYFLDALDDRRLGTNNLYADDDGIARRYHVYRDAHGWRIHSLPANVVAALGGAVPQQSDVLLNWRGRPPAFRTVSFAPLYADMLKQKRERPVDEFAGKIVVIGSTAPSLFDLKPTSVARDHPGLEILATGIDNLKNGDFLTELPGVVYVIVTALGLALLAAAFVYNADYRLVRTVFTLVQTGFLAVTYLFLNYTTVFVDLTVPFTAGLAYFFVASAYGTALTLRRNGDSRFATALDTGRDCQVLFLVARFDGRDPGAKRRVQAALARRLGLTRYGAAATRLFKSAPLLHDLHRDTALYYWLVAPGDTRAAIEDLFHMITNTFSSQPRERRDAAGMVLGLHAARFTVDAEGRWREQGRRVLAESLALAEPGGPPVRVNPAFATLCREQGKELPPALEVPKGERE